MIGSGRTIQTIFKYKRSRDVLNQKVLNSRLRSGLKPTFDFFLNGFIIQEKIELAFSLQSLRLHMLITKAGLNRTLVLNESPSNRILNKQRFISKCPFFVFNFSVILVTHSLKFICVKKLKGPSSQELLVSQLEGSFGNSIDAIYT